MASKGLTYKQELFVTYYCSAEVAMNATEAARRAGYKGSSKQLAVIGSENIRKPNIREEIERRLKAAHAGAHVTVESILIDLHRRGMMAERAGNLSAAIRSSELQGKYLKMFTDRIEHVQTLEEVSDEQLIALLREIVEAGNVDFSGLLAGIGSEGGGVPDSPGTPTTH